MQELSLVAEYDHAYEKAYSKAYRAERATSVESGFDIEEAESKADYEAGAVASPYRSPGFVARRWRRLL